MDETSERKSWADIITAASASGLAIYALIALVVSTALVQTALKATDTLSKVALFGGAMGVLGSMVYFIGKKELGKGSSPGFGQLQGAKATESFLEGNSTEKLEGRWEARWFEVDDNGQKRPYRVKDPETGEVKDYPPDIVAVEARKAVISCNAHDRTTGRVYWMEGRLSNRNVASLLYWGQESTSDAKLVGVLLLRLGKTDEGKRTLKGQALWHDRKDREDDWLVHGWTEWTKQTKD